MPIDFSFPAKVRDLVSTITPLDIFDILIVAMILYKCYQMLQDTRAITLVKGLNVDFAKEFKLVAHCVADFISTGTAPRP